jgi:periplasmic divalent cation tolerance protein
VPNEEAANKVSSTLVEKQLAACVNIIPGITSVYKWEGKINVTTLTNF